MVEKGITETGGNQPQKVTREDIVDALVKQYDESKNRSILLLAAEKQRAIRRTPNIDPDVALEVLTELAEKGVEEYSSKDPLTAYGFGVLAFAYEKMRETQSKEND